MRAAGGPSRSLSCTRLPDAGSCGRRAGAGVYGRASLYALTLLFTRSTVYGLHNKPAKFAAKFVANLGVSSSLLTPTANPGTLAVNC